MMITNSEIITLELWTSFWKLWKREPKKSGYKNVRKIIHSFSHLIASTRKLSKSDRSAAIIKMSFYLMNLHFSFFALYFFFCNYRTNYQFRFLSRKIPSITEIHHEIVAGFGLNGLLFFSFLFFAFFILQISENFSKFTSLRTQSREKDFFTGEKNVLILNMSMFQSKTFACRSLVAKSLLRAFIS